MHWATRVTVIQSPFGGQVNGGAGDRQRLRERTGVEVELQSNDDGILFAFPMPTATSH
ncbi:MAG: hypothetical protein R2867_16215 [Caldilineaceae bacterium]